MSPKHLATEIKNLRSLDHPNILKIHDMFQDRKHFFVVMDPWQGDLLIESLSEIKCISENIIAKIIFQILIGVSYCHSKNVIHRDLNPKLILFYDPSNPKVKILEFGTSSYSDPDNLLAGKMYPKIYIAPEVFTGAYDEKCDLWSVGIILYLLICGELPRVIRLDSEQDDIEINADNLRNKGISEDAIDLILKLLEKDCAKRISAAQALEHDWIKKIEDLQDNKATVANALNKLKEFKKSSDAKDAVKEFIARQILSYEESIEMVNAFKEIDTNWDGKISKEELYIQYAKTMNEIDAKHTVENIFLAVDRDNSGFIEYDEFIKANMQKQYLTSLATIDKTFKLLDTDNNHKLLKSELQILIKDGGDEQLMKLIVEADIDGDGEIDFKEFYALMRKSYDCAQ